MFEVRRLRSSLLCAFVLSAACYTYPPPPEIRWVETPVGKAVAVGGAVRAPRVISRVNPAATNSAGVVDARVVISPNGNVSHVEIVSATDNAAAKSARDALARWKFAPTIVDGVAVPVVHNLKLTFREPT